MHWCFVLKHLFSPVLDDSHVSKLVGNLTLPKKSLFQILRKNDLMNRSLLKSYCFKTKQVFLWKNYIPH